MKAILITNNPSALDLTSRRLERVEHHETDLIMDVFVAVRDYVHAGHRLLTHPLSGSVKPYETLYKSVLITAQPVASAGGHSPAVAMSAVESLIMIEDAIVMARNFEAANRGRRWTDRLRSDFQLIDRSLIQSGLESLEAY